MGDTATSLAYLAIPLASPLALVWWSWALGALSVVTTWWLGSRRRGSWLLALAGCALWVLYGAVTRQWGLALGSAATASVCLRNWLAWR